MATKNILILGGQGFIGRNLVAELSGYHRLLVFDRGEDARQSGAAFIQGDFTKPEDLEKAFQQGKIDLVIHLVSSTIPSSGEPVYDIESNLISTIRLLELMKKYEVPKILFVSSGGTVYGRVEEKAAVDELHPTNPISSHGIVKLAIEKYLQLYQHLHDIKYLIVRFSNPYGEFHTSEKQGLINVTLKKILAGKPVKIWGNGAIVRDYIYIKDCAAIVRQLIEKELSNEVINVGSGTGYSVNEVLAFIKQEVGDFPVTRSEARNFDVPRVVLDNRKLRSIIDFPFTDIRQGIRRTYRWLKASA